ncbi:tripartite tricarboxylate transporter substrate binding protein [Ramlibacter sp. USB13]|uniref:Tripartite tricarboxylate transporter substrate binding protein n=1 Tax=Ramlibacter cellulosilyticus TaxID=2764187 RepID=A0A923SCK5_9BURK|nr:tripartite tricarboxylate transporter substrate binding protein [Ramlibacter cellulosilyticus]MBC5784363.1 tripartite tricarboxylate transporter substrate binding protein [Ramlibacter cellulosilyticus]
MDKTFTRRHVLQAIAAAAASCAVPAAFAQGGKPVRIVVGFTPGGAADVMTRIIAKGLAAELGTQVIVDNKPGADGIISAQEVMKAPADGTTILMGTNTAMVAVPALRPNPPYEPFKAFTPISSAGEFSMFLAVAPQLPAKTLSEFLDLVAANPGKYTSASSNSASELAMLQLLSTRGAKVVNARYKGDAQALTDLASGQISMMFSTGTLMPAFVKEGKAKALVTLLPRRSPLMPDVPTAAELGIGKLTITPWAGFFGPAGMPADVTEKLSAGLRAALARPDVREQLVGQGFSSYGMTPAEFSAFFHRQYDGFVATVRENNVKFD